MRRLAVVVFLLALSNSAALAQTERGGPPPNVRMRVGPLFINPTLALTNAGTDTNVFNESVNPKSDLTVTVTPGTDLWLRMGPTWLQSNIAEDLVWFQKYASERSANNRYAIKWLVPLNRLTVTPSLAYVDTRERPGFEIDTRAQRTETVYGSTVEVRAFSKIFLGATASRTQTNFDGSAEFLGINLRDELNRHVTSTTVTARDELTPLTSVSLLLSAQQDRFDFDHVRDSDSRAVSGLIAFDPAALLKGRATFGYRDFKPLDPSLPGYRGATANVDLSYVLLSITKFVVTATRDVQYSYDINQPYYVLSGATASIAQQVFGPIDVVARGGLQQLQYRDRLGAAVAIADRVDHVESVGGGIGYHLGHATRIGFNVDQNRRISGVDARRFRGLTYGFSVTYGS